MPALKIEALALGSEGEEIASRYLQAHGLKVVHRRYHTRWGEIDLVCRDRDAWVFVEVKSRAHASAISPLDALTAAKQKKIVGAALSYLKRHGIKDQSVRFDVVMLEAGTLTWVPGAFEPALSYTY
jgi:putative endonuclease